jgi:DNA-binding response OmpR family regulator
MRILLVDDDVELSEVLARRLVRKGFEVLTAPSLGEAISVFDAEGGKVDAVLSDLNLGIARGTDVFRMLAERGYSGLFVIMSGDIGEDAILSDLVRAGRVRKLEKPFELGEFLGMLANKS